MALDDITSGSALPPVSPSSDPSAGSSASGPALKRPTGIKATLGYNPKPKRLTGLKVLVFVVAAVLAIMSVRMLAAPGGGPLMDIYRFVMGAFLGGS